MLRILRAFAWVRWRVFMNSLEKTGARDTVERFSLAVENIAPIVLAIVMVPSALALAGLAGYAGYQLAAGAADAIAFQVVRYILLAATAIVVVAQVIVPVADRTNPVRFLLLPISHRTLYVAQGAAALSDPWILVLVPMVFALPIGMVIGGAYVAALAALAAGTLVLVVIVAVSALTTTLMHLLLRDRRRGELIALVFVLVLPLVSMIPAALDSGTRRSARSDRGRTERQERRKALPAPRWAIRTASIAFRVTPSELYTSTVTKAVTGRVVDSSAAGAALAALAAVLHGIGLLLFGRVLATPPTSSVRRQVSNVGLWTRVLPGLSPGASAVALAHVRLALRTPRGRSILFSPLLMLVFFGFLALRSRDGSFLPFVWMSGGIGLASFAAAVALLSILPIAMNQFAVDGAGLTLSLLSPLSTRQLLVGKAVGNGLIAVPTALLCVGIAAAVFRGASVAAWLSLTLSLLATYVLACPAAAVFSAIFPRVVDMNSIGRGSNAHGLSGLLGLASFGLAALPCIGLVFVAKLLGQPAVAPFFLLAWCGVCFIAARLLLLPAGRIFDKRRENLSLLM